MTTVLIVDDDPVYRHLHGHVLRSARYDVVQADNLASSIATLSDRHVDIVLADYVLPDGTGLDLLERLESSDDRPRFVLVTGKSDAHELDDARVSGVDGYLTKPASSVALRDLVTSLDPDHCGG